MDVETVAIPRGLEILFVKGEQIPWKGIWFEVATVEKELLTLKPVGMTWQRYKATKKEKQR